ncbi:hypothetical protein ACHAWO_009156 [Cyclotella atomus]|jgi:adenylate kinase|uniref:Adenylate kinase n=1 Tax=Cyclotella atomus TaxID=382360 RepID=A0ABD3PN55_9STRA
MTNRLTTIISLIGAPGSGKGTYGSMLASRMNRCTFLSVGDVLREYSEQSESMSKTLQSGDLVDDTFVNDAVLQRLVQLSSQTSQDGRILILDGFPRNQAQTVLLSKWPRELQKIMALHFDVPDDICITKLLGRRKCTICNGSFNINGVDANGFYMPPILPSDGSCPTKCNREIDWKRRDDDTEETIRNRMNIYHEQTEPVLEYWLNRNSLLTFVPFNGVDDIDVISDKVGNALRGQFK